MATIGLSTSSRPGASARAISATSISGTTRLAWIDTIRVLLTILVVAHHAGQPYGPGGDWPILETARSPALGPFFAVNAAFFMGLFFLISGYFLPGAYDRKGPVAFLRDRFLRLGAPLLLFGLAAFGPITYLSYRDGGGQRPFWSFFVHDYLAGRQIELGHLWFLAHLLVYAVGFAAWRHIVGVRPPAIQPDSPIPSHRAIFLYTLALAAVTFVVRIWFPIDRWTRLLWIVPAEVAHLPQYLSLFILGITAARHDWLSRFPTRTGFIWLRIGLAAAGLRYGYTLLFPHHLPRLVAGGGADWRSLLWSGWEAVICVGLCLGLLTLARERMHQPGPLTRTLSTNAYAAYVMHVWVVVAVQFALLGVPLPPLAKFALVCLVGIPLSFVVASLVRRLPPRRRGL